MNDEKGDFALRSYAPARTQSLTSIKDQKLRPLALIGTNQLEHRVTGQPASSLLMWINFVVLGKQHHINFQRYADLGQEIDKTNNS